MEVQNLADGKIISLRNVIVNGTNDHYDMHIQTCTNGNPGVYLV